MLTARRCHFRAGRSSIIYGCVVDLRKRPLVRLYGAATGYALRNFNDGPASPAVVQAIGRGIGSCGCPGKREDGAGCKENPPTSLLVHGVLAVPFPLTPGGETLRSPQGQRGHHTVAQYDSSQVEH